MTTSSDTRSARSDVLDLVLSKIEAGEAARRSADAEQLLQLAKAFHAVTGSAGPTGYAPGSSRGEVDELAFRALRAEIACALHLSEQTVERRISHAVTLTAQYPATLSALRSGSIGLQHTNVITDAGDIIGVSDTPSICARRAAYEVAVLEVAADTTPGRLRPIARRLAEQFAEVSLDERHERARNERGVFIVDREDGMTDLIAHLPSLEAHGIYDRITRLSRVIANGGAGRSARAGRSAQPEAAAEPPARRTRNEIRADLFAELLLKSDPDLIIVGAQCAQGATGRHAGIQAQVQVTITDTALWNRIIGHIGDSGALDGINHSGSATAFDSPEALLTGCGPISTDTACDLAAAADRWNLLSMDSRNGAVIAVETYRPSAKMKRVLMARDEHCRFPGCRAPVHRCDIDHTVDAQFGGPTATSNLAHLCRGHHTMKHHGGWRVKQKDAGVLEWWSPTGRKYLDRPPSMVRFEAVKRVPSKVSDAPTY